MQRIKQWSERIWPRLRGATWAMALPAGTGDHFWLYFPLPLAIWYFRRREHPPGQSWLSLLKGD